MITVKYSENNKSVIVTTLSNKKPVTRVITDKITKITIIEVYKQDEKTPIETYVYNKI